MTKIELLHYTEPPPLLQDFDEAEEGGEEAEAPTETKDEL